MKRTCGRFERAAA